MWLTVVPGIAAVGASCFGAARSCGQAPTPWLHQGFCTAPRRARRAAFMPRRTPLTSGLCAAAGIITIFERWCETGPVARKFQADFRRSGKSTEQQIRKDVAQAIVKVIGTVHLAIQVRHRCSSCEDPYAWCSAQS